MVRLKLSPIALLILTLSACAVGPDYAPPTLAKLAVPQSYSNAAAPGTVVDGRRWWTSFNDPQLTAIIDLALKQNLDIDQAVARLRQAREALVQSNASLLPTVRASTSYSRNINIRGQSFGNITDAGIINENFALSTDASYQVDLFGGIRRGIEASRASQASSAYSVAQVQNATASEVARNYILARAAQANLAITRGSLAIQDDNLQIVGFRMQAGLVSSLDTEQTRSQRAQTATQVPLLEQSFQQAANRLGVLTGQAPGALKAELAATQPIPSGPDSVPVGIPADIIRLRPDVLVAERNLAAATAQIGVAEAQLYPALNLTASISTNAGMIDRLTDIITGRIFASLAQTIFDAGRNRSIVRSRRAAVDGAFAAYKLSVLRALEDVENALTALQTATARGRDFTIALDAATNAATLARSQYRAGLTDITTLNNSESALFTAQNGLSNVRADRAQALVQLYLALGGGWDSSTPPSISSLTAPAK